MDLFKILFTAPELGDSIVFKRGEQETRAAILDITTNHGGTIRRVVNTAKAGCAQDVTREFVNLDLDEVTP